MRSHPTSQLGFTLVEMIVSLALFSMVVTVSVGALLVLIASNEQLQAEQSVMTNLSFALDSMAREIRTGTNYFCLSANNKNPAGNPTQHIFADGQNLDSNILNDCADGNNNISPRTYHGISFVEGGESITKLADTRIVYFYDNNDGKIYRRISGGDAQSIVSSGIYITDAEFYVTGSKPLIDGAPDHDDQAAVTIFIEARETSDTTQKPYRIQTTITQRTLDI